MQTDALEDERRSKLFGVVPFVILSGVTGGGRKKTATDGPAAVVGRASVTGTAPAASQVRAGRETRANSPALMANCGVKWAPILTPPLVLAAKCKT